MEQESRFDILQLSEQYYCTYPKIIAVIETGQKTSSRSLLISLPKQRYQQDYRRVLSDIVSKRSSSWDSTEPYQPGTVVYAELILIGEQCIDQLL
ncbi:hypothetical protein TNCV_3808441 [Trichonephila clavipes]|nr:hypothetical protein TNCV_3808441 [Trichonephila clavipes]